MVKTRIPQSNGAHRPAILHPQMRIDMEMNALRLYHEWRDSVSPLRRLELAKKIDAILLLLNPDDQRIIGEGDD